MRSAATTAFAAAAALSCLAALPVQALGQSPMNVRSFISIDGDDGNSCVSVAPCRTFAGAYAATATGGSINVLGPGDYGVLSITRSITVNGHGHAVVAEHPGDASPFIVDIPPGATNDPLRRVTLRGLIVDGAGVNNGAGTNTGDVGVIVRNARTVRLEDMTIVNHEFDGVRFRPAFSPSTLYVSRSTIADNFENGIAILPGTQTTPGTPASVAVANRAHIRNAEITGNGFAGVSASTTTSRMVAANVTGSLLAENGGPGILARGAQARVRMGRNEITGNLFGIRTLEGGTIASLGGNAIFANYTDGSPTSTVAPK